MKVADVWTWLLSVNVIILPPLDKFKVKLPGLKLCLYLPLATDITAMSSDPLI